jgi:hypothetical protein
MNRRIVLLGSLSLACAGPARAQRFGRGAIAVELPWAKPSVTEAAAVFMALRNDGAREDRLMGGTTDIAERVILREFDGSPLDYYELLPRRPILLRPGRRYIALRGLKRLLAVDDMFPLTLHFAEAGKLDITVRVAEGLDEE